MYTEEQVRTAIEMARELREGKDTFDIESILGLTEVQTSIIRLKYTEEEIIEQLNNT